MIKFGYEFNFFVAETFQNLKKIKNVRKVFCKIISNFENKFFNKQM